ncbi:hypothetical protein BD289DRAFT_477183 [Coniella lustricola]|uniref:NADH:flavin oxidoreductase/NADH oxidase N-terminal domain-containing protein n=1 Tax=Coniella lustricola TaxID=2025994 RepID=A0A2T2ZVI8_9PEZI|nr:hypothetical protein BD289DRAFT_477183 [Coniella lustricola]
MAIDASSIDLKVLHVCMAVGGAAGTSQPKFNQYPYTVVQTNKSHKMSSSSSRLAQPLKLGRSELSHRVAMAPLTRFRASDEHVPIESLVPEYYSQRACVPGTLIISEATFIHAKAAGLDNAPGIWSEAQIKGWEKVTDAVHANKGTMFLQLWALGRTALPDVLKKELGPDAKLVSSGNIPMEGGATPTALTEEEIWEYVGYYAQAAKNAIAAGFDGVEIHGANGYLIDQFTQDTANNRTDKWGGSIENRARFAIEVTKAVVEAVGADRTGIRLSPFSDFQSMKMADPYPQFNYLIGELKKFNLAFLHLVESRISGNADTDEGEDVQPFIDQWDNVSPVLLAGGFKADSAYEALDKKYSGKDVIIVFGRLFIANPDLVFRLQKHIPLTPYNRETFYNAKSAEGYTDLPYSEEFLKTKA